MLLFLCTSVPLRVLRGEKNIINHENTEKHGEKSRAIATIQITCKENIEKLSHTVQQCKK
ncbi:MAG: hypothetical protein ACP5UA_05280 [Candidatus Hydrogenedens sp.]